MAPKNSLSISFPEILKRQNRKPLRSLYYLTYFFMRAESVVCECVCDRERERSRAREGERERSRQSVTTLLSGIRREFCPVPVFPSLLLGIFVSSLLPRQHILNHTVKTKYCCVIIANVTMVNY